MLLYVTSAPPSLVLDADLDLDLDAQAQAQAQAQPWIRPRPQQMHQPTLAQAQAPVQRLVLVLVLVLVQSHPEGNSVNHQGDTNKQQLRDTSFQPPQVAHSLRTTSLLSMYYV